MSRRHDVLVVGGRVAGAATALHLARAGHDVLVVDRAGPPADTTSTHALMRTGVLQLMRMQVLDRIIEAGTPAIRQVDLVFGDERISFPVADKCGVDAYYAPRRTVLDPTLLEAATGAGAEYLPSVWMSDVTRDAGGRVNGIVARIGSQRGQTIEARHVVGADGSRSRVARAVGARLLRDHPTSNTVAYGYFEGLDVAGYEFRFVDRHNVGYVPTNDGLTLVFAAGRRADSHLYGDAYLTEVLARVAPDMAESLRGATRVGRLHRASEVPNVLRRAGGPGWSLVGDAGFTEDPIAAHGLSDALRDAELVAAAIDRALRDPDSEGQALADYNRQRDGFAHALLDNTVPLARFDWGAAEASRLLRGISEITETECQLLTARHPLGMPLAG